MTQTIKTRFAPSPTGMLHIGGARTALFAYLFAKHHQGQFVLRIEDTDRERSTDEATAAILAGMQWLGLAADEGPFYQTERMDRYQAVIQQLLDQGKAYRCYCSKARLEQLRDSQMAAGEKPRYDGCCRDKALQTDAPFVVRFKNPIAGDVVWRDAVLGDITISNQELDDFIIARSDGTPTYNFTVVVDDMDMQITHVIRGNDHVNNTPRQMNVMQALGYEPPVYAHVPMILNEEGKKLSKRDGAANLLDYRDQGYLPEALLNYLVRLGWSHGDQEVFSMAEMVQLFDLSHLSKSAARLNHEKLQWLNQQYLKQKSAQDLAPLLEQALEKLGVDTTHGPSLELVAKLQQERVKTIADMAEQSLYFYQPVTSYDDKAVKKNFKEGTAEVLEKLLDKYQALETWQQEPIHEVILSTAEELDLKLGKVAQPLRIAVTGGAVSPALDQTLLLLGRERVVERLGSVLVFVRSGLARID